MSVAGSDIVSVVDQDHLLGARAEAERDKRALVESDFFKDLTLDSFSCEVSYEASRGFFEKQIQKIETGTTSEKIVAIIILALSAITLIGIYFIISGNSKNNECKLKETQMHDLQAKFRKLNMLDTRLAEEKRQFDPTLGEIVDTAVKKHALRDSDMNLRWADKLDIRLNWMLGTDGKKFLSEAKSEVFAAAIVKMSAEDGEESSHVEAITIGIKVTEKDFDGEERQLVYLLYTDKDDEAGNYEFRVYDVKTKSFEVNRPPKLEDVMEIAALMRGENVEKTIDAHPVSYSMNKAKEAEDDEGEPDGDGVAGATGPDSALHERRPAALNLGAEEVEEPSGDHPAEDLSGPGLPPTVEGSAGPESGASESKEDSE